MESIYFNNQVEIQLEVMDDKEVKVNVNGKNLIWISLENKEQFVKELNELLDKYRI